MIKAICYYKQHWNIAKLTLKFGNKKKTWKTKKLVIWRDCNWQSEWFLAIKITNQNVYATICDNNNDQFKNKVIDDEMGFISAFARVIVRPHFIWIAIAFQSLQVIRWIEQIQKLVAAAEERPIAKGITSFSKERMKASGGENKKWINKRLAQETRCLGKHTQLEIGAWKSGMCGTTTSEPMNKVERIISGGTCMHGKCITKSSYAVRWVCECRIEWADSILWHCNDSPPHVERVVCDSTGKDVGRVMTERVVKNTAGSRWPDGDYKRKSGQRSKVSRNGSW